MNTLQEHGMSLNSVPCAYFRVSLRDCAIRSSRWVDLADFGLVWFRFFVRWVRMMQAFVNETTARLRWVRVFVKLYSVTYVAICCLPHMAIVCHHERGSTDIFCPHTESSTCGSCAFFIPWTAGVNIFSDVRESGLRDEHAAMRVAHGDAMVADMSDNVSVFCARKNELTITTFTAPNRFFLFFTYPHACMRA
jgi:hypothetical protein